MSRSSHSMSLLKSIYEGKEVSGGVVGISNANQYLIDLEAKGLIIREWKPDRSCKIARINPDKIEAIRELIGVSGSYR